MGEQLFICTAGVESSRNKDKQGFMPHALFKKSK